MKVMQFHNHDYSVGNSCFGQSTEYEWIETFQDSLRDIKSSISPLSSKFQSEAYWGFKMRYYRYVLVLQGSAKLEVVEVWRPKKSVFV